MNELDASYAVEFVADRARAEILREQLDAEAKVFERAREREAALLLVAKNAGRFVVVRPDDQVGRYHRQGEVLGFVFGDDVQPLVKVVVAQSDIDSVGLPGGGVQMRLAHDPSRVIQGRILRQQPAGKSELPSRVLTQGGGGLIATDPQDAQGLRALERVFQIDVEPQAGASLAPLFGQRVFVRFEHPPLPLGVQWYRGLRRLFLAHFNV